MRPRRIQLSGGTLMLLLYSASLLVTMKANAQCSAATMQSTTYSQTFTGSGNDPYTANFPKLDMSTCPGGCIFIAAVLKATLTVSATITMESNPGPTPAANFKVTLDRDDDVSSTALGADLDPTTSYPFKNNNLAANDGVPGSGPDYKQIGPVTLSDHIPLINDSITGAGIPFQGTGDNTFTYTSTTNISGPSSVNSTADIHDTIVFSITYYYCPATVLASNILTFTATRENDQTVKLDWITTNEQAGRTYSIEVSNDGKSFSDYASQAADPVNMDASYTYNYPVTPGSTGSLYFRLKQVDVNGTPGYSPIRIIDLGAGFVSGFLIYPNPPSDYLNLLFPSTGQGWQVDIISADGSLVQRNYYNNTNSGRLNFQHELSAGTYFARATDLQMAKSYVASFLIH